MPSGTADSPAYACLQCDAEPYYQLAQQYMISLLLSHSFSHAGWSSDTSPSVFMPRAESACMYLCMYARTHEPLYTLTYCREFKLSSAHPKTSKQAALERHEQQQQQDSSMRPHICSSGRGRSQSVGKQRASGEQRLEQLARPKTAHWDKCECMCVLSRLLCTVTGRGMDMVMLVHP